MSLLWPCVSKETPCPVCGSPDWCAFGDFKVKCMRVQSAHASADGGWYHSYPGEQKPLRTLPARAVPPPINAADLMNEYLWETTDSQLGDFAARIGVSFESLQSIGAAWCRKHSAWAFPMRDGFGNTVGIRLRSLDGFKWAVTGSRSGIFWPKSQPEKVAWLCEGPTSTAAALSLGLFAIGRPNCSSGDEILKVALERLKIYRVVIVADNDDKPNGLRPGFAGAWKLKKSLRLPSVIWTPPVKDIRQFLNLGGTRADIDSEIKNMTWTR